MASASITITITDAPNHSLATIRDKVCLRLGYSGPDTNPAKIAFIQDYLARVIKTTYVAQLQQEANAVESDLNIQ